MEQALKTEPMLLDNQASVEATAPISTRDSFWTMQLLENHYPALHGLRVCAILLVMACHTIPVATVSIQFEAIRSRLWFGMDLFFILSGFLIGSILHHILSKKGIGEFPRFYLRRAFRILPLYFVVLVSLIVLNGMTPFQKANLFREILFISNYNYSYDFIMPWGWSISLEEQFYLISPFLMFILFKLSDKARMATLVVLFFVPLVLRLLANPTDPYNFSVLVYTPTHMRFDSFVLGIALSFLVKENNTRFKAFFTSSVQSKWFVLGGVAMVLFASYLYPHGTAMSFNAAAVAIGTLVGLGYVPIILWALYGAGPFHQFFSSKVFRRVATLGYGVFLVHVPLIILIKSHGPHWIIGYFFPLLVAAAMSSLFVSYGLHLLVEKPALWLRTVLTESKAK